MVILIPINILSCFLWKKNNLRYKQNCRGIELLLVVDEKLLSQTCWSNNPIIFKRWKKGFRTLSEIGFKKIWLSTNLRNFIVKFFFL